MSGQPPVGQSPLPPAPPLPPMLEFDRGPAPVPAAVKPRLRVAKPAREDERTRTARLQTSLARAGFSPGLIDGKTGAKTRMAIEECERATGSDLLGESERAANEGVVWTRLYRLTESDGSLITGPVPTDWNERAKLVVSGYESFQELLAERGWCTQETVAWLNPSLSMDALRVGDEVVLPDVPDTLTPGARAAGLPRLARLEVSLSAKVVRGFSDAEGTQQVSLMHCSVARLAQKRPVGELRVKVVATDPSYTFDPKDWPEVEGVTSKLTIAPGPRNPVGSAWVGLDGAGPGYGLHGTVRPQDIGKTGSHGCFRLANWDAVRLARAVKVGTTVIVKE